MRPFHDFHFKETCRSDRTSVISSYIDAARISTLFAPKRGTSCQQSPDRVADQSASTLQLQSGTCQTSPYRFQSFLVPYGQHDVQQKCSLEIFEESQCSRDKMEVILDKNTAGQCWLDGGESVMLSCGEGRYASDDQGKPCDC